ncbi:MAG: DUF2244 domain-containing protein [Pseudomonadota bacterium]
MPADHPSHEFTLSANCSLSARQAVGFFCAIAGVSLTIAIGCALLGYWPILPFAGLELALFGWALRHTWRRGQHREYITIDAEHIELERVDADGEPIDQLKLPRAWTRVDLIADRKRPGDKQLAFGREGRWTPFGDFLIEAEKRTLLRRLRQVLSEQP